MGVSDWVAMGGWVLAGGEGEGGGAEPEENGISVACPLDSLVPSTQPYRSRGSQSLPKVLGQCSGMADPEGEASPTKTENRSGVLADESCLICLYRFPT